MDTSESFTNPNPGKVLFLGPKDSPILTWLRAQGEDVIQMTGRFTSGFMHWAGVGFLVSYGYTYIIGEDVLDKLPGRAINLHISYLPWNRGADPNLWSWLEDTPKGVTIHYLDKGIDTGPIIVQRAVKFDLETETLATSYEALHREIGCLFNGAWADIKTGICQAQEQDGRGSFHRAKDKEPLSRLLVAGWQTPISALSEYALARGQNIKGP